MVLTTFSIYARDSGIPKSRNQPIIFDLEMILIFTILAAFKIENVVKLIHKHVLPIVERSYKNLFSKPFSEERKLKGDVKVDPKVT